MAARIRARLAQEDGFTLPELLTSMAILAFVLTAILGVFVSGLNAEVDMNNRFQAQQNARLALTSMRQDIRTACDESVPAGGTSVSLTYGCSGTSSQVTWCADSSTGAAPYTLYRQTGASCAWNTGVSEAGSLTTNSVFVPVPATTSGQRPEVQVTVAVDANPATSGIGAYKLSDTIMLRNAAPAP